MHVLCGRLFAKEKFSLSFPVTTSGKHFSTQRFPSEIFSTIATWFSTIRSVSSQISAYIPGTVCICYHIAVVQLREYKSSDHDGASMLRASSVILSWRSSWPSGTTLGVATIIGNRSSINLANAGATGCLIMCSRMFTCYTLPWAKYSLDMVHFVWNNIWQTFSHTTNQKWAKFSNSESNLLYHTCLHAVSCTLA